MTTKLKLVYLFHIIFSRLEISIVALKVALLPMEIFFVLISASKITGFSNIPIQLQRNIEKTGKNLKQTKSAKWPNKKLSAAILGMGKKPTKPTENRFENSFQLLKSLSSEINYSHSFTYKSRSAKGRGPFFTTWLVLYTHKIPK